ncbi:MAG: hypothetical protein QOG17_2898 [Gammaproteobacteria bacterium]|nr:hypothetical protein [Gammaproteobacteria bacterium]
MLPVYTTLAPNAQKGTGRVLFNPPSRVERRIKGNPPYGLALSYTKQLRDFAQYGSQNGLRFDLYVRPGTEFTGPLQQAIESGTVNPRLIPGL